jgi:hypothetical protein
MPNVRHVMACCDGLPFGEGKDAMIREADRLLGWAEFNLTKGKVEATLTLIAKARRALGSESINTQFPPLPMEPAEAPHARVPVAGRFVLLSHPDEGYCTSWDTWEEASVAFERSDGTGAARRIPTGRFDRDLTARMPAGFKLFDQETGRTWLPGARYYWEDAAT